MRSLLALSPPLKFPGYLARPLVKRHQIQHGRRSVGKQASLLCISNLFWPFEEPCGNRSY